MEKDPETENDILMWRYEPGSKTRQGQDKPYAVSAFHPTEQVTGTERCPVKIASHIGNEQARFLILLRRLRASLCKILISSFAHKMDFANNFSVDSF